MNIRPIVALVALLVTSSPVLGQPRVRLRQPLPLPPGTAAKYDLAYVHGGGKAQSLDLFVPADAKGPLPLVVWIHGGGWRSGDKRFCPAVRLLAEGYAVASINYRLTDEAPFPAQVHDCKAAIRWLRANAAAHSVDPERIGVWGSSAGGHLAALLGTAGDAEELEGDGGNAGVSSRVLAVCDFFGPADLTDVDNPDAPPTGIQKLLGGSVTAKLELARQASPVTYVSKDDPPFLIVHGTRDPVVDVRQSRTLHEQLRAKGVEAKLEVIEGAGHGGLEFASPDRRRMIVEFFDRHLKPSKP